MSETKTYTRSQLAVLYGVHYNTFNRWILKAGIVVPRGTKVLTPQLVGEIKQKLGEW